VLILDLPFSGVSISDLAPIIHRRSPVTAIIVSCDMNKEKYGYTAFSAGVSGFLIKEADMDKLSSVVKIVSSGGYFFSTPIIIKVFNNFMSINQFPGLAQTDHKFNLHLLSPAEHSIVTLIAQGFQDEEIARYLNLSTGTIRNCITAIKRKTKLKNRIQIVIFSIFFGIISTEQLNFLKINSYKDQFNRQILNDQIQ
jgi:DNA-binding NarL/FixJ family response regulator